MTYVFAASLSFAVVMLVTAHVLFTVHLFRALNTTLAFADAIDERRRNDNRDLQNRLMARDFDHYQMTRLGDETAAEAGWSPPDKGPMYDQETGQTTRGLWGGDRPLRVTVPDDEAEEIED